MVDFVCNAPQHLSLYKAMDSKTVRKSGIMKIVGVPLNELLSNWKVVKMKTTNHHRLIPQSTSSVCLEKKNPEY